MTEDQRIFQRFSARYPAKFKDTRNDYGVDVLLRDASAEGIKISCKERFFLNDHVALEVSLPGSSVPMELKGRVVWATKKEEYLWDIGVQFHQTDMFGMARMYKHANFPSNN